MKYRQVDGLRKVRKPIKPKVTVTSTYTRSGDYWTVEPYKQTCLIEAFYKEADL